MFYILWIEDSTRPPTTKFNTLDEAKYAAGCLVNILKKSVHIMQMVDTISHGLNQAKCKHCLTIVESTDVHQMVWCKCKKIAVDGGSAYKRRVGNPEDILELD
jgi:hypothetical protein